jgi:hypothetical protein
MTDKIVEANAHQIRMAKEFKAFTCIDNTVWQRISAARKAMIKLCSDGRYSRDILNYIWSMTDAQLHLYASHGGALSLARKASVLPPDSTLKRDKLDQMRAAHEQMGYDLVITVTHGPECKAACGAGLDINRSLDQYATVPSEVTESMPRVETITLFHNDKRVVEANDRRFSLYEFHPKRWVELRRMYPEPQWLPGSEPIVSGLSA